MPETKEKAPEKGKKGGKGSEFFKKHKNAILITGAVVALIVLYIYIKSRNSSSSNAATTPVNATGADNTGWSGNYSGSGQGSQGTTGAAGNAGPAGPAGPPGPPGVAVPRTPVITQAAPLIAGPNPLTNPSNSSSGGIQTSPMVNTALSNAAAFSALTASNKPVVSTIGTQKTVNPQGGNGRIITMPATPAPAKKKATVSKIGTQKTVNPQGGNGRIVTLPSFTAARPKPAAPKPVVKAAAPAPKPAPKPVIKVAAPPQRIVAVAGGHIATVA